MKTVLKMLLKLLDGNINKVVREEIPSISYETVIEQVKMLPEQFLASVSAFIKLLETEQGNFTRNHAEQSKPKNKQAFFALAGKFTLTNVQTNDKHFKLM